MIRCEEREIEDMRKDTPDNRPELLAPAGSEEAARAALRYGADALYCGGPMLQLRAESAGLDEAELARVIGLAHAQKKKLYVAVNSFVYDGDFADLVPYAKKLQAMGADAVIVSDIGAIAAIRRAAPELEIHLSTQANCMNSEAARVYYDMGVRRIVLARELSIDQISAIRKNTPVDLQLEAFVHGAMCMAYSGRCLISSYLTGRSANRGDCTQSCRWYYSLTEEKRPGESFPVFEDERGTTILSSGELCCLPFLNRLRDAGVSCYKIEGRMRTPYSVGIVVNAYRMAIDDTAPLEKLQRELDTISHRPYSSGFYLGDPAAPGAETAGLIQDWRFVAQAVADSSNGTALIETRNRIAPGDTLEVVSPGHTGRAFTVEVIRDECGQVLDVANVPMRIVSINCPWPVAAGDLFRARDAQSPRE